MHFNVIFFQTDSFGQNSLHFFCIHPKSGFNPVDTRPWMSPGWVPASLCFRLGLNGVDAVHLLKQN